MKRTLWATLALMIIFAANNLVAQTPAKPNFAIPTQIRIVTLKGPTGIGMLTQLETKTLQLTDGRIIPLAIEVAGTPDIMDARIAAKQADFVTLPVNQAARLYNLGTGLKLGGVNIWGVLYLLSSDPSIGSWASLKGKKVYSTGKGATPDIVFRELATLNGLNPDLDLNIDYTYGQVELAQLMLAGKIELACLPEPFVTRILLKKPAITLAMDLQKEWALKNAGGLIAQGGIAVAADFGVNFPEVTRELLAAYAKSNQLAVSAADAPQRVAALDMGIDAESFKASLGRLNLQYKDALTARPAVEAFLKAFLSFDPASIGGKLPDAGFYFK